MLFFCGLVACSHQAKLEGDLLQKSSLSELDKQREKSDLYTSIGKSYERRARFTSATESFQEAIKQDATNAEAHFLLGRVLLKRRFSDKGLKYIQKALQIKPDYTKARNYLAYLYYNKFKKQKAYDLISQSSEDLVYFDQEETWALKFKLDRLFLDPIESRKTGLKAASTKPIKCVNRMSIVKDLMGLKLYSYALSSARLGEKVCRTKEERARLAFLKSHIFIRRGHYLVARDILSKIETEDNKLKNQIPNLMMSIHKKLKGSR